MNNKRLEIRVAYYNQGKETHHYNEKWVSTKYYCPNCGEKSVWVDSAAGDYYAGPKHLCSACGHGFSLPEGCNDERKDEQSRQRLKSLPSHPSPVPQLECPEPMGKVKEGVEFKQ